MINLNSDIRLTDELERQLMQQAIDEQARFKPSIAIKNLFVKLSNTVKTAHNTKTSIHSTTKPAA